MEEGLGGGMERWMDQEVDGWMDGDHTEEDGDNLDGWMDRGMDGCKLHMHEWMNGEMYG